MVLRRAHLTTEDPDQPQASGQDGKRRVPEESAEAVVLLHDGFSFSRFSLTKGRDFGANAQKLKSPVRASQS